MEGLALFGGYFGFTALRRSRESRRKLYINYPSLSNTYYWTEDLLSHGQQVGTRLRNSDLHHWLEEVTEEN